MMEKNAKIYVAGHRGMVGSAIVRGLERAGYTNIVTRTHRELDLTRQADVEAFFREERPEYVFLAAARVGGIIANSTALADFMYENMMIERISPLNDQKMNEILAADITFKEIIPTQSLGNTTKTTARIAPEQKISDAARAWGWIS